MFTQQDNLDWDVRTTSLCAIGDKGRLITVPGKVAQVRNDTDEVIGITGKDYSVFQNSALKAYIEPLVEEGVLEITNIGTLKNGGRVYIQAQMTESYQIAGEEHKGRLTLLNSHDGSSALAAGVTDHRVVCSNTFAMALQDMSTRLRHTRTIYNEAERLTEIVYFINKHMYDFQVVAEQLATTYSNDTLLRHVIEGAYRKPIENVRASNKIVQFYRTGMGNEGRTLWDAVNAVTEYTTHHALSDDAKRFGSANFGLNAAVARRAYNVALSLI